MTYVSAPQWPLTPMAIARRTVNVDFFFNFHKTESDTLAPSCKFLGQNSEYPSLQNFGNFSICPKISKSQHLTAYETANRWHIQKCVKCRKCVKKPPKSETFRFKALPEPPSVSHPPKMVPPYSPAICPPKTPKPHQGVATPSLRKNWFSETPIFCHKYSNGPGVAKNWHVSNLTRKGPRTCHKLSWVQIWQKNSNGKCPKLAIRDSHARFYKVV